MPLFIRRVTRAAYVDFFYAVEARSEAQAELAFDTGEGEYLGEDVGDTISFVDGGGEQIFAAGSRTLPAGINPPANTGPLPFNPLLRRIVIESVLLLPHADLHLTRDRLPYRLLLEANEGDLAPHPWAHQSRIVAAEDVAPSGAAAALAAIDARPDHYDELAAEEAEGAGFALIQVGEHEAVWIRADEPDHGTRYDTALQALTAIEHDVAREPSDPPPAG